MEMEGAAKKKKTDKVDLKKLFRFQSFTERIANIRIDVIHHVSSHTAQVPEDCETFFAEGLQKWRELNCTLDFGTFLSEIRNHADSLAQLVHHKDQVIGSLLKHLQVKNSLAYEPLLDLVVQVARDLQSDFYPHFRELFPILLSICNIQNAELIQNVFTTLAYLFKFLWRHMLRDIQTVYQLYSELLLQHQKPHIRQFAVESFGFLLRKVRNHDSLFEMIFNSLASEPELMEGVGQLLFEVCKGVQKQFHSCTDKVLPVLLGKLSEDHLPCELVFQSLTKMVGLMAEHTRREFSGPVWDALLSHLSSVFSSWKREESLSRQLGHTLHLMGTMVSWRKGSRVPNGGRVAQILLEIISEPDLPDSVLSVALHLATSLLLLSDVIPDTRPLLTAIVREVCGKTQAVGLVTEFFKELAGEYSEFQNVILPEALRYCEAVVQKEDNQPAILEFLCGLCLLYHPVDHNTGPFTLDLDHLGRPAKKAAIVAVLRTHVERGLLAVRGSGGGGDEEVMDEQGLWAALVCLEHVRPAPKPAIQLVQQLYAILKDAVTGGFVGDGALSCEHLLFILAQSIVTLVATLRDKELVKTILLEDMVEILRLHPSSLPLLLAMDAHLTRISSSPHGGLLSSDRLVELLPILQHNLSSPSSKIRLLTLRVLSSFHQLTSAQLEEDLDGGEELPEVDVLKICLQAEQIPTHLNTYREKLLWLQKLKCVSHTIRQLPEVYKSVPLRYLTGMLYVNFSLVWEPVCEFISSYAMEENGKFFWSLYGSFLEAASETSESPPAAIPETSCDKPWHESLQSLFQSSYSLVSGMERGQADHANFRRLLWRCVGRFPEVAEPRSRILVPLLLRFIQNEYALREDNLMEFQDLRKTDCNLRSVADVVGDANDEERREDSVAQEMSTPDTETSIIDTGDQEMSTLDAGTSIIDTGDQEMSTLDAGTSIIDTGDQEMSTLDAGTSIIDTGDQEMSTLDAGTSIIDTVSQEMSTLDAGTTPEGGMDGKVTRKERTKQTGGRALTKTLATMLTVFSKFHNPKSFYKQEEVWQLYMKLLTHRDSAVQKLSLECLLAYKPPFLLPYRENFERLLDDTLFREELVYFSVDVECSVVAEEHREQLLPVLVRLLYGRMQRQGGPNTTKGGGANRRGIVLRFLAGGCRGNEMEEFVDLMLLPFRSLLDVPPGTELTVDVSRVIPLKKQQGFLNMVGQFLSILGSKAEPFLPTLFPILLRLASSCSQLLTHRDMIQPHCVTALKALRQLAINRISECFDSFTEFDFSPFEEELFRAAVWPQVERLPRECIQHPTPLMKLLFIWSKYPRYHQLLNTTIPEALCDHTSSPAILHYVYGCLFSPGVSQRVCSCVMEITVNLLGEGIEVEEREECVLVGVSEGVRLVLSFTPKLLDYLNSVIRGGGREGRNLQLEFSVLSKISGYVTDPSDSALLIKLLLRSIEKYRRHEGNILQSICNLVTAVDQISGFYRPLAQLFSLLSARQSRTILCDIFQELADKDPQWKSTADIVVKLNAWDPKHVDEPAYGTRLEGYSEAKQMLQAPGGWSVNGVLPILHTSMFFSLQCEDMSVRDAAASYVSELITHIQVQDGESFQHLVMATIVNSVKHGLRSKQEFARHESISLLAQLVRIFPSHTKFSDMTILTHKDPEADFFENVKHIQLHRRTRAFRKLAAVCLEGALTHYSMTTFLLPLASQIVFTPSTNTEQNLVAEATNVIGAVAGHLKWSNYCFLLRHYLRQLPKRTDIQKVLIKVVVVILNAFHFDLSGAPPLEEEEGKQQAHRTAERRLATPDTKHDDAKKREMNEMSDAVAEEALVLREEEEEQSEGDQSSSALVLKEEEEQSEGDQSSSALVLREEPSEGDQSSSALVLREEPSEGDQSSSALVLREEPSEGDQSSSAAQRIHGSIVTSILPSLQAVLTKADLPGHKLSRRSHDEQSQILRVPVAIAMTKLLLALPKDTLNAHLPGLLLKVCQTLKNRSHDVRDIARGTLVKMANALGPKYLTYIVKEMKDLLTRGYQLHVLSYSLHSVLNGISSLLKAGDLDQSMEIISQILVEDLFGTPAEEREIGDSVARIPESKMPQGYNSYEIVARFLSPALYPDLLVPVKQVLETKVSSRVARVVEEVFHRVGLGIHNNETFTPQALLVFVHGLVSESIPQLAGKTTTRVKPSPSPYSRPDSHLLPPTPGRGGPKPTTQGNLSAHIITEFGLQLLQTSLKRGKFDTSSEEQLEMLDPFVSLLSDSLTSRHIKVLSRTLQCLVWVVRMPLPSLDTHIHAISSRLFDILKRYARAGAATVGSNRDLALAGFKAMTVVLRDFKKHEISEDELRLLLSFVEEDIHDYQRQSTAFPLLKAILGRKFIVTEMRELMLKVAQLSVTAEDEHTRQQCRQAVMQFIMDYPLGKKLNKYFDFYVTNLSYETQSGRESVIELLVSIFTKFPEELLHKHAIYFFVPLASQLANDDSPTCRVMIAQAVKTLLKRLDTAKCNDVASITETWINQERLIHKRLGVQILGLLVEVEGLGFEKRLATFLPLLLQCLNEEDRLNDIHSHEETPSEDKEMDYQEEEEDREADMDHLLFSTLSTLEKIYSECSIIRVSTYQEQLNELWGRTLSLLLHPHSWVRVSSCRLFGLLFAAYEPREIVAPSDRGDTVSAGIRKKRRRSKPLVVEYLLHDSVTKVQELCSAFCMQLSSPLLNAELANQAVKNLVFLAKVLHGLEIAERISDSKEQATPKQHTLDSDEVKDLNWLVGRLSRLARFEAGYHPKESMKRTYVLQWIAAISVDLGQDHLAAFLPQLLGPIFRELADTNKTAGEPLYNLAQEVVDVMKGIVGRDEFSQAYAQVHQSVLVTRERRRKEAALEAVANPEKTIRRKQRKNQLKAASKKRKIVAHRPAAAKKIKLHH